MIESLPSFRQFNEKNTELKADSKAPVTAWITGVLHIYCKPVYDEATHTLQANKLRLRYLYIEDEKELEYAA